MHVLLSSQPLDQAWTKSVMHWEKEPVHCVKEADYIPFHSRTHPSSPEEDKMVPVTFQLTLQTWKIKTITWKSFQKKGVGREGCVNLLTKTIPIRGGCRLLVSYTKISHDESISFM